MARKKISPYENKQTYEEETWVTQGGAATRGLKRVRFVSKVESSREWSRVAAPPCAREKKENSTHSVFVACFKIKILLQQPSLLVFLTSSRKRFRCRVGSQHFAGGSRKEIWELLALLGLRLSQTQQQLKEVPTFDPRWLRWCFCFWFDTRLDV